MDWKSNGVRHHAILETGQMKILASHPFTGLEFDWLAVDDVDRLALFSSAGYGPIPAVVCRPDYMDDLYGNLAKLVQQGEARLEINEDNDVSEWLAWSRNGLYVYDWCFSSKVYRCVSSPLSPLARNNLPSTSPAPVGLNMEFEARGPISLSATLL